ncbi:hypothetical protein PSENEW3n2_00002276 [Picochlorum sp. SENEW3]|nr:hypothetical protein PSENEW3n2_00002276 [Picochlorum sp. SENEW3]WPT15913.1 hypothetical protein PSENEW3_00002276 [Picochlorum sp. SENEW3]
MKRTRYPHGISANQGRFVDSLAVAYKSHADNGTHVSKRKQRNKDVEIVFDPDSHREFVTGFRKRKQQRRKEAIKSLEKLQRENVLEERAERREARRQQYNLKDNEESGSESESGEERVSVFDGREMRSTVKVCALSTGDDSDEEQMLAASAERKKSMHQKSTDSAADGKSAKPAHKLSKTALTVLSNTKMKVEGKKKFSSGGGGKGKQCKTSCSRGGKKNLKKRGKK